MLRSADLSCTIPDEKVSLMEHFCFFIEVIHTFQTNICFYNIFTKCYDSQVIITYLSYLCARLLDLRLEGRAARIIQLAWRKHLEEKQAREIKVK